MLQPIKIQKLTQFACISTNQKFQKYYYNPKQYHHSNKNPTLPSVEKPKKNSLIPTHTKKPPLRINTTLPFKFFCDKKSDKTQICLFLSHATQKVPFYSEFLLLNKFLECFSWAVVVRFAILIKWFGGKLQNK